MKNVDSSGSPILTETAKNSFLTFIELCTFKTLSIGIRNLILNYLIYEDAQECWFADFIEQARLFYDLVDDLEREYPENQ